MPLALVTSHFEMSPINAVAYEKMRFKPVTLDTSHSPVSPCGLLGQLPLVDNFRQSATALLSSMVDCGENTGAGRFPTAKTKVRQGLYHMGQSSCLGKIFGMCICARTHARTHAPLQGFGDMPTRRTRNRIQSRDGKRICACCRIASVDCACVIVCIYMCISVHTRAQIFINSSQHAPWP